MAKALLSKHDLGHCEMCRFRDPGTSRPQCGQHTMVGCSNDNEHVSEQMTGGGAPFFEGESDEIPRHWSMGKEAHEDLK